jgi:hypothetical protein
MYTKGADKTMGSIGPRDSFNHLRTTTVLTDPRLEGLIRHIARLAAEDDYRSLQKTGEIPHSEIET